MNTTRSEQLPTSGLAITSLVLGILTLTSCWFVFVVILPGVLAVVFGFMALRQVRMGTAGGKELSIAGILCGILGMLPSAALAGIIAIALIFGRPTTSPEGAESITTADATNQASTPYKIDTKDLSARDAQFVRDFVAGGQPSTAVGAGEPGDSTSNSVPRETDSP